MSSDYAPKVSGIMSRKVLGVPVIYLAAGFVLILAVYAWRTKTAAPASDAVIDEPAVESFPRPSDGTVIVQSQTPPTPPPAESEEFRTNSEWVRSGVEFLVSQNVSFVTASKALQEYVAGHNMSFAQHGLVNRVIKHQGLPPVLPRPGSVGPQPAKVQGTPPCNHIVKNASENSATELAQLYYGRSDVFAQRNLSNANEKRNTWRVGETVKIPALPVPTPPGG